MRATTKPQMLWTIAISRLLIMLVLAGRIEDGIGHLAAELENRFAD